MILFLQTTGLYLVVHGLCSHDSQPDALPTCNLLVLQFVAHSLIDQALKQNIKEALLIRPDSKPRDRTSNNIVNVFVKILIFAMR